METKIQEQKTETAKAVNSTKATTNKRFSKKRKFLIKRPCSLCAQGVLHIDYKDVELLKHYIANNGRILPRRITNLCAKHQRMVANAIKRARIVALLPFVKD